MYERQLLGVTGLVLYSHMDPAVYCRSPRIGFELTSEMPNFFSFDDSWAIRTIAFLRYVRYY